MFSKKIIAMAVIASGMLLSCGGGETKTTETKTEEKAAAPAIETGFFTEDGVPVPEVHASTVLQLSNGDIMAAWFGGNKEGTDDVGIFLVQGRPGNWSAPKEISKIREDAHWNPVLAQSPDGKVVLFFKVGKKIPTWETWYIQSEDNGNTWSEAKELVVGDKGGRGPVKNKPIILSDGKWIAGASHEDGPWEAFADISTDNGATWKASPHLKMDKNVFSGKGKGLIQPTLWESAPGKVHMLLRSTAGAIYRSDSQDGGQTWSDAYKTNMPNPNSGIDLTKLNDGTLVLAYNPDTANWGSRSSLSLAISTDNGTTWPKEVNIAHDDTQPGPGERHPEFSYPAVIHNGDTIIATYTWNRKKVAYWIGTKGALLKEAKDRK